MDVLIGFVTKSDPAENPKRPGPAQVFTAAKAIQPGAIHLLYTPLTKDNFEKTRRRIQEDPDLKGVRIIEHYLEDLLDARDYIKLKDMIPKTLRAIRREHPGGRFHLISGLAQVRFIFALCLTAWVLDGTLYEVSDPDPENPWPKDRQGYQDRLRPLPMEVFNYFRELGRMQFQAIRLRIDPHTEQAWIDGKRLDLRATAPDPESLGQPRARTFQLLLLLAAEKRYGRGEGLTKRFLKETAYVDKPSSYAGLNLRRAVLGLNRQVRRLTERSDKPLDPLIIDVKRQGRPIGQYRLTERLDPADETIEFITNPRAYIEQKLHLHKSTIQRLFPYLPPEER